MDIQTAKNIINDIVDDLTGRRGLRQEWEQIDEDIISEILEVWQDIVLKHAVLTSTMHSDGKKPPQA